MKKKHIKNHKRKKLLKKLGLYYNQYRVKLYTKKEYKRLKAEVFPKMVRALAEDESERTVNILYSVTLDES